MNYTDDKDQVVFLKDGDIAVTLEGKSASGAAILLNGVPSFDLLSTLNSALSTYDENLSTYIRDKVEVSCEGLSSMLQSLSDSISAEVDALSTALSNDIAKLSADLSGDIDALSAALSGEVNALSDALSADIGKLSADLSSEIGCLSDALSGEVNALSAALSTDIDKLSADLSADISHLSDALSADIDQLRDEADELSSKICLSVEGLSGIVDWLSAGISADVTELSAGTKETSAYLNSQVIALWADVKGGVNYKGHLKSYRDSAEQVVDLSSIFLHSFPSYTPDLELNNGWLYCFTTDEATGKYTTKDGIELEDRDYIIIHSHDEAVSAVAVSAICRDTVDIIDTADSDYVRISLLQQVSADLSADYTYKIDHIMDKLPILDELSANDLYLSNEISTTVAVKVGDTQISSKVEVIHVTNDEYNAILAAGTKNLAGVYIIDDSFIDARGQVISNLADPTFLSAAANKKYVDVHTAEAAASLSSTVNAEFVHLSGDSNIGDLHLSGQIVIDKKATAAELKVGTDAWNIAIGSKQISATSSDLGGTATTYKFTLPAKSGDIAVFSQIEDLSAALSTDINALSAALSADIDALSAALSNDIDALSAALSADIKLSAEQLDSEIKANDADIAFLSNDLSTLEYQHYSTTLSAVDRKTPAGSTISSDNLVITDPYRISGKPHDMYYMTFEYGTLVLKKMA